MCSNLFVWLELLSNHVCPFLWHFLLMLLIPRLPAMKEVFAGFSAQRKLSVFESVLFTSQWRDTRSPSQVVSSKSKQCNLFHACFVHLLHRVVLRADRCPINEDFLPSIHFQKPNMLALDAVSIIASENRNLQRR